MKWLKVIKVFFRLKWEETKEIWKSISIFLLISGIYLGICWWMAGFSWVYKLIGILGGGSSRVDVMICLSALILASICTVLLIGLALSGIYYFSKWILDNWRKAIEEVNNYI